MAPYQEQSFDQLLPHDLHFVDPVDSIEVSDVDSSVKNSHFDSPPQIKCRIAHFVPISDSMMKFRRTRALTELKRLSEYEYANGIMMITICRSKHARNTIGRSKHAYNYTDGKYRQADSDTLDYYCHKFNRHEKGEFRYRDKKCYDSNRAGKSAINWLKVEGLIPFMNPSPDHCNLIVAPVVGNVLVARGHVPPDPGSRDLVTDAHVWETARDGVPDYRYEKDRLASFASMPKKSALHPIPCAKAGLYFTGGFSSVPYELG